MNKLQKVNEILKGGKGSGNFGHGGRTGKRGGSARRKGGRKMTIITDKFITNPGNFDEFTSYLNDKGINAKFTVGLYDRKTGNIHLSTNKSHSILATEVNGNDKEAAKSLEDSSFHLVFGMDNNNNVNLISYDTRQSGIPIADARSNMTKTIDDIFKNLDKLRQLGIDPSTKVSISVSGGADIETTVKQLIVIGL